MSGINKYLLSSSINDKCYKCEKNGDNLITPCGDTECSAKIHKSCLYEQYKSGVLICKDCANQVAITVNDEFNARKCLKWHLGLFYTFFIIIGGSIEIILFSLGKTANSWNTSDCDVDELKPCGYGTFTICFSLLLSIIFWQLPLWPSCRYNIFDRKLNTKNRSYLTMMIMLGVSNVLVVLAHIIGYIILKYIYNEDKFFTYKTSLVGFSIYIAIILSAMVIIIVYWICQGVYSCVRVRFSKKN